MQSQIIDALTKIVGQEYIMTSPEDLYSYSYDATPGFQNLPDAVVRPANTEEVSKILALANSNKIPVYTRGSGTKALTFLPVPAL